MEKRNLISEHRSENKRVDKIEERFFEDLLQFFIWILDFFLLEIL